MTKKTRFEIGVISIGITAVVAVLVVLRFRQKVAIVYRRSVIKASIGPRCTLSNTRHPVCRLSLLTWSITGGFA